MIAQINMTSLIDVSLVLVLILLVTAPLLSVADLPVDLPQARTREAESERNVSVSYSAFGEVALDDQILPLEDLRLALAARLAEPGNQDLLVVVRADSHASYVEVEHLLREARAAGATRLAVATRQKVSEAP